MNEIELKREIADGVEIIINSKIVNSGKCDYHVEGLIISKENNLYDVKINGEISTNLRVRTGMTFEVGDRVDILVRNGDFSRKMIDDYIIE